MPFTSICPKCGARFRLLDKMHGQALACDECGKKFVAGGGDSPAPVRVSADAQVAEEIRKLRLLITRMLLARMIWNLIMLGAMVGLGLWAFNHRQDLPLDQLFNGSKESDAQQQLKKLLDDLNGKH